MKIVGVTHPIPTKFAKRIYSNKKTVLVLKSKLLKVKKGDKLIIYESYGAKAYTGWANIKKIGIMSTSDVLKKYKNNLIISEKEFASYIKSRTKITVIEFENFEKFDFPVIPKRYVSLSGKYIREDEFKFIEKNKD